MKKAWTDEAWEDYLYIQTDKKLLKKANALLKDIERGGYDGIGKPEPLKGNLSGYYSRRIDDYNRIVYRIENNVIEIVQCGTHYHDWYSCCLKISELPLEKCKNTLTFPLEKCNWKSKKNTIS